jgi:hypothetical protein
MKSLSFLIVSGIVIAVLVGAIFAVYPVSAEKALTAAPKGNTISVKSVVPSTGETTLASSEKTIESSFSATSFNVDFEKDFESAASARKLKSFIESVSNGYSGQVTGIYAEDLLAFPVVRQPDGNAGYVSTGADDVTQFRMAADYGSKAFLAHNYLAGATFFELSQGQVITLVYGDGSTADFQIQTIRHFQALSPTSPYSNFIDLDGSGEQFTATQLFYQVYNSDNPVVLQTCIANEGESSWGRLFVIAVPVS